ncbi:MAG: DUF3164 family protein [Alphaproteobacteria bacterium]|nr:DUF3164 family protein [Alphaproteobacteria bacterium]
MNQMTDDFLRDARGNLIHRKNVRAQDLLMDEMVKKIIAYAQDLSSELARFEAHTHADLAAFSALLAQEYDAQPAAGRKGNRSLTSFDGTMMIKVAVADRVILGPELQIARDLLDEMIKERAEGADQFLVTLVNQAFRFDKEGKVDTAAILALRRLEVADRRWPDVTRAIDDAIRVIGSKTYLRFYTRPTPDASWTMVPLDLAAVSLSAEAMGRRSIRRRAEEAEAALAEAQAELARLRDVIWMAEAQERQMDMNQAGRVPEVA